MKQENKKRLVRELKRIYEGPKPVGKQAFLAEMQEREENPLNRTKIGRGHMLTVQLRYISKGVWALSLVIFFTILWSSRYVEEDLRWAVCAGIPFLGMVMVLESFRSMACGMEELELSYAMTIHKAMGSEYDTVIIPLLAAHRVLLTRNLLYTAVTRAKGRVLLVGQKKALFMVISKTRKGKRNTLLAERMRLYHKKLASPSRSAEEPPMRKAS